MTSKLEQMEQLLSGLSSAEKSQLLKWIVSELGDGTPGIESRADVCGGEPCIVRTRIPVWVLEQARRIGCHGTDERAVFAELCQIVQETIDIYMSEGRPLPPVTSGYDLANRIVNTSTTG